MTRHDMTQHNRVTGMGGHLLNSLERIPSTEYGMDRINGMHQRTNIQTRQFVSVSVPVSVQSNQAYLSGNGHEYPYRIAGYSFNKLPSSDALTIFQVFCFLPLYRFLNHLFIQNERKKCLKIVISQSFLLQNVRFQENVRQGFINTKV